MVTRATQEEMELEIQSQLLNPSLQGCPVRDAQWVDGIR